jgi:hypothetical protein
MKTIGKTCAAVAALTTAALPWAANAACLNRTDMHAMQAAALQQHLMVAAFTCHDTGAYNRFVLSHRSELQKSDAMLLAYFQDNGGTAAYHTYKTHLANAAALESSRSESFCSNADMLFHSVSSSGSLDEILDRRPVAETGYAACYVADADPVSGESQKVARAADPAPTVASTAHANDSPAPRRVARSRWDRDDDYGPEAEDSDAPPPARYASRSHRYAQRSDDRWDRRYGDDRGDWGDRPAYDDRPYDDWPYYYGPGW